MTPEPPDTETPGPTLPMGFFPIAAGDANNPKLAVLLGGMENGAWIDAASAAARLSGGEEYRLYSAAGWIGNVIGTEPTLGGICPQYLLQWEPAPAEGVAIGLGGEWDPSPRTIETIDIHDESIRGVASEWLSTKGIPDADVRLTRALRVDLEGDGIMEELIAATRMSEATGHNVEAGDYSFILLHKGTDPQRLPVAGEYYSSSAELAFPNTFSLSTILDLNGDGWMEIIVTVRGWETSGTQVYAFDGTAILPVFNSVCSL